MTIQNFGEALPASRRNLVERKVKPVSEPRVVKPLAFDVVKWRNADYIFIKKRGDKLDRELATFPDWKSAHDFKYDHHDELVRLWSYVKERDNVGDSDIRSKEEIINTEVTQDVTPERFLELFPFRGVEFGKWQDDRQGRLNKAANALLDLSKLVGLTGSDLTLNIGLAFGARGTGKAAAHWESDTNCINLTKTQGGGCMAHEWYHAYDLGDGDEISLKIPVPKSFIKRCERADASRNKKYWRTTSEVGARCFEQWVKYRLAGLGIRNDYLVNIVTPELFSKSLDCYPYLLPDETEEVFTFFDKYFEVTV